MTINNFKKDPYIIIAYWLTAESIGNKLSKEYKQKPISESCRLYYCH